MFVCALFCVSYDCVCFILNTTCFSSNDFVFCVSRWARSSVCVCLCVVLFVVVVLCAFFSVHVSCLSFCVVENGCWCVVFVCVCWFLIMLLCDVNVFCVCCLFVLFSMICCSCLY